MHQSKPLIVPKRSKTSAQNDDNDYTMRHFKTNQTPVVVDL